jgi:hypothetical protein
MAFRGSGNVEGHQVTIVPPTCVGTEESPIPLHSVLNQGDQLIPLSFCVALASKGCLDVRGTKWFCKPEQHCRLQEQSQAL